jgi:2-polyprenyl-3-methyl-5-hydroxy-6-metoxy-1,4-benzoquinol methylase
MKMRNPDINIDIHNFLARFQENEFISTIRSHNKFSEDEIQKNLTNYTSEVKFGFSVIEPSISHIHPKKQGELRILEVGAGPLLLSLYLCHLGYQVTALEPIGLGFQFLDVFKKEVLSTAQQQNAQLNVLEITGEELNSEEHGPFDLIFSINVLEHVINFDTLFSRMCNVLAPKGKMIHTCPNYMVPFEPHFAIPLIPFQPKLTKRLFTNRMVSRHGSSALGIWNSLNFISSVDVMKACKKNHCNLHFVKALLHKTLIRLEHDDSFRNRQSRFIYFVYLLLKKTFLLDLIKFIPAQLVTPMEFHVSKEG